jgi:tetratricopeptide (TPR) repeat protein
MKRKKEHKQQQSGKKNLPKVEQVVNPDSWKYYFALAIIILISFIAYLPVFHNSLLAWDDDFYIKNNPLIYSINLKEIFSQYVLGNYHPVTILTLATEYYFFGLNATGYHTVNLMLHLLNVILVFYTVFLLSDKAGVALVAALLFGIHPLHVESVAWAAELKDLLYTFFFLASYIFYLKYLKKLQKKFYLFALLLFLVSLLSKAMAASLPVVLVLTDYFKGRKISIKTILEKVPFFLLAFVLGVLAILAQRSFNSIQDIAIYTFPQRIVFACYGFITYLSKLLLPLNLSAIYPYPVKNGVDIPIQYYAYVIFFLGLAACTIYSYRFSKKIIFGMGFFFATVFLVLQLLPVGNAIMADRYSYIPSIGIFYLAGEGFNKLWRKKLKLAAIILLSAITVLFSVKTYARCGIWKNDMTLWNDVISQYQIIERAYNNRGVIFKEEKRNDEALNDFNKAIELKPDLTEAYYNRGNLFANENRDDEALNDFNKAIELKPGYADAHNNRGLIFMNKKRDDEALNDFNKAIEMKPNYAEAYYNRGILLMDEKRIDEAINDFNKTIELEPDNAEAYINRGNLFMNEKRNADALNDFNKAIELKPDFAGAYIVRGNIFLNEKRYEEAIGNYSKAIAVKNDYAEAYYNRGLAEFYSGKKDAACMDLKHAASLGYQPAIDASSQICK